MRRAILQGAVERAGLEERLGRLRYNEQYLPRLIEEGVVVEAAEGTSLADAVAALRTIGDRVLILPNAYHPSRWEAERGVKDRTEAYDGLDYPRRIQATLQRSIAGLRAEGTEPERWLLARAQRQTTPTKELIRALGVAPMDLATVMMTDPVPLPETGIGLPRARREAKEERGSIGYAFATLDTPHTNVLIPWYVLVEGAANAARQFLLSRRGAALRAGLEPGAIHAAAAHADIERRRGGTFALTARHEAFPGSALAGERYQVRLERIAYGPRDSATARLQEWLNPPRGLYASCGCDDSKYRGFENTWHAHPAAKLCKHQASAAYWMQAVGTRHAALTWHASPFLLPLREGRQEGKEVRYSQALRVRRLLRTRLLVRDAHGRAEPTPLLTQSLLYGAVNGLLIADGADPGAGLFMPGIMTGERLAALARQEAALLRDPTYQGT